MKTKCERNEGDINAGQLKTRREINRMINATGNVAALVEKKQQLNHGAFDINNTNTNELIFSA